jgi:subtilisin family serine protease
MNSPLVFVFLVGLACSLELLRVAEPVKGQYIVLFKSNISSVDRNAHIAAIALNSTILYEYDFPGFQGYAAEMDLERLTTTLKSPLVKSVEENGMVYASDELENIETLACEDQEGAVWGLVRSAEEDLVITGSYKYLKDIGNGVTAYIIDTGIYIEHNDFEGRATWGNNFVDNSNSDGNGHGTHVAGTIGSKTYGLAKGANLVAVKVLNAGGSGTTAGVIAGIDWVAQQSIKNSKGKKEGAAKSVANMSLGGGKSTSLNSATNACVAAGVVMAVASGNDYSDACNYSPASSENAITTSASDNTDSMAYFSNWGSCVDVFGPGVGITSTWKGSPNAINTISGTSMASPHIAGVAAKLMYENPSFTQQKIKEDLVATANQNKLSGVRGSPNKLVYHGCIDRTV